MGIGSSKGDTLILRHWKNGVSPNSLALEKWGVPKFSLGAGSGGNPKRERGTIPAGALAYASGFLKQIKFGTPFDEGRESAFKVNHCGHISDTRVLEHARLGVPGVLQLKHNYGGRKIAVEFSTISDNLEQAIRLTIE